ncbi:hypothetical protein H0H92_012801 [Tricholoma furcatifolium]|nr:hypothetical protein H0H92_012801 [Tricholoma furcatifolium]
MAEDRLAWLRAQNENKGLSSIYLIFWEIKSIQDALDHFSAAVARIKDLNSRSLYVTDQAELASNTAQLQKLSLETSEISTDVARRVKDLDRRQATLGGVSNGMARRQQVARIKSKFVDAIHEYQKVEQEHRIQARQHLERQFKIVNPNASPEEIKAVVDSDQDPSQFFSQSLLNSNYTASKATYREVQARHEDLLRIEQTLTELARLVNEISLLVEEQDDVIFAIETQAHIAERNVEAGFSLNEALELNAIRLKHTDQALIHAREARKKRWICFGIVLLILLIIAAAIAAKYH